MSEKYKPKKGDEIEVTLRGTVHRVGVTMFSLCSGGDYSTIPLNNDRVLSIEKLGPELPTVPGSVIRSEMNVLYFLSPTGWRNQYGQECFDPERPKISGFEVLYDAGAVK